MSVTKITSKYYIMFRPFKTNLIKIATGETNKVAAQRIEKELLWACRNADYKHLTDEARLVCIKMFINQEWEMPPGLVKPEQAALLQPTADPVEIITFGKAMKMFFLYPETQSSKSFKRYGYSFQNLIPFFGDRPTSDITIPLIKEYRLHRLNQGASPATVNKEVSSLSKMFGVLQELGHVSENPVKSIRSLSEKSGERESYISYSDFQLILTRVNDWFRPIVQCAYYTGMRRGEIVKLKREQVNLDARIIYLSGSQTKEGHSKRIPISRELEKVLKPILAVPVLHCPYLFTIEGSQTNPESYKRQWRNAVRDMEPRPQFKDLRATFKTNALHSGIDQEVREAILGHQDGVKNVKQRYGHIMDNLLIQSIDMMSYNHGPTVIIAAK